jgi:hypothetical protein
MIGRQIRNQNQRLAASLLFIIHRHVINFDPRHGVPPFAHLSETSSRNPLFSKSCLMRLLAGDAPQAFASTVTAVTAPANRTLQNEL